MHSVHSNLWTHGETGAARARRGREYIVHFYIVQDMPSLSNAAHGTHVHMQIYRPACLLGWRNKHVCVCVCVSQCVRVCVCHTSAFAHCTVYAHAHAWLICICCVSVALGYNWPSMPDGLMQLTETSVCVCVCVYVCASLVNIFWLSMWTQRAQICSAGQRDGIGKAKAVLIVS